MVGSGRVRISLEHPAQNLRVQKVQKPYKLEQSSIVFYGELVYIVVGKLGFYANVWSWEKDDGMVMLHDIYIYNYR